MTVQVPSLLAGRNDIAIILISCFVPLCSRVVGARRLIAGRAVRPQEGGSGSLGISACWHPTTVMGGSAVDFMTFWELMVKVCGKGTPS